MAFLLARRTRQAHFATLALSTVLTAYTFTATAAFLLAPLSIKAVDAALLAYTFLVARSVTAVLGAANATRATVLKQARKLAIAAAMWQACPTIAATYGKLGALLVAVGTTVTLFDSLLAVPIRLHAHGVNAAVGAWSLAFGVPPLMREVTSFQARPTLVAVSSVFVAAWVRRLLAIRRAFVSARGAPMIVSALIDASASW